MMPAISSVTRTMSDDMQSGMTCLSTMRKGDAPMSFTAAMKSELRKVMVSARAMRA
ncbi:hypothetical protein D3C78_1850970 [compost metagenome]